MGLNLEYIEGQTPIDEDEKEGLLIKTISTRGELDEFEQANIQSVFSWGGSDLSKKSSIRKEYLNAIYKADDGDYRSLIEFAVKK